MEAVLLWAEALAAGLPLARADVLAAPVADRRR
jgi:hypothetical protein